ncbi:MAG TPA: MFS transporter [Miltoncostaeaceae bacterium]|nr:MFS transporter [Miltoncostaeaceae bacterium]
MDHEGTDGGARHAVRMLGIAQAAAFAVTGITVTIGPLSLHELSGREGLGGALLAVFILAGGAGAFAAGRLMRRAGRRAVLVAGHLAYGLAGVAVAAAGAAHSPRAILAAAAPLGAGHGAALLGRSVAVELHPEGERGRAVGRILAVGAVGALSGPGLVAGLRWVAGEAGLDGHMLPWLAVTALGAVGALAVSRLRLGPSPARAVAPPTARPRRRAGMGTATLVVAGAQASMLALMSVVPVHIHHQGGGDALMALILGAHLASMYGLAPLLGAGIDRWGHRDGMVAAAGLCVAGAMLSAATHVPVVAAAGLVALGAGWCAGYLAVTAAAGAAAGARDPASALGAADLVAGGTAAAAGILTGALVGVLGIALLAWLVASAMGVLLVTACRPRTATPAPAGPGA